ncbi:MAG: PilZ domain-containing protein, partial [Candidatus Eremiobacterota bacterium]
AVEEEVLEEELVEEEAVEEEVLEEELVEEEAVEEEVLEEELVEEEAVEEEVLEEELVEEGVLEGAPDEASVELLGGPTEGEVLFQGAPDDVLGAPVTDIFGPPADAGLLGPAPDVLGATPRVEAKEPPPVPKQDEDYQKRLTDAFKALQSSGQVAAGLVPRTSAANEKRRVVRLKCHHKVEGLSGDTTLAAVVTDIGLGGVRLALPQRVEMGQEISVRSLEMQDTKVKLEVHARVVWCKPNPETGTIEAGLQFQEDPEVLGGSWVSALLHQLGAEQRHFEGRKHIRALAGLDASVQLPDASTLHGKVQDLGLGGGQLLSEQPLPPQTPLKLQVGPYGEYDPLNLTAEVLNSRYDDEKKLWAHSLKFVKTPPAQLKLLGRYVVDLLKDAAG